MATKKLVRNPNTPSLKSQGAGYSTTDRKGNTTFYKSSKDASGYSDTTQSRADMSKGTAISKFDTAGQVISSETMKPVTPVNIVTPKITPVTDITANNAGLTGGTTGMSTQGTKLAVDTPTTPAVDEYQGMRDTLNSYLADVNKVETPSGADIQRKLEKESNLKQYQQEANNLSGQLNTIVANRDAAMLSLEQQGRGQTSTFVGGEQSRIEREAAIKALPLQAQLAQAQGNVALAQDHINTWGKILMDDATNKYNAKRDTLKSLFDLTSGIERDKVMQIQKKEERAYTENQNLIKTKTSLLTQATGQGAPASIQNAIRNATTVDEAVVAAGKYNGDLLAQEAQRANLAQSYASTANIYDQISSRQQALEQAETQARTANEKAQIESIKASEKALEIKKVLTDLQSMSGKNSAVGVGFKKSILGSLPFVSGDAVSGSDRADFEAAATRAKNLLTLDNLKLMSGVLSETDIKILETAGSNLANFSQSEKSYDKEIQRVIDSMNRTVSVNGITPEQGIFWGILQPDEDFTTMWNKL